MYFKRQFSTCGSQHWCWSANSRKTPAAHFHLYWTKARGWWYRERDEFTLDPLLSVWREGTLEPHYKNVAKWVDSKVQESLTEAAWWCNGIVWEVLFCSYLASVTFLEKGPYWVAEDILKLAVFLLQPPKYLELQARVTPDVSGYCKMCN